MKCQDQTSNLFQFKIIVHVCLVLFIVCSYICVCECLLQDNNRKTKHKNNTTSKQHSCVRGPLRECHSIRSGASGLPYYCAPLVCVSEVIEVLPVWRHTKPKTKNLIRKTITVKHPNFSYSHKKLCIVGSTCLLRP